MSQLDVAMAAPHDDESIADHAVVDALAATMKAKLDLRRQSDGVGWETQYSVEHLANLLIDHVPAGNPVDIANFALMIFNLPGGSQALRDAALLSWITRLGHPLAITPSDAQLAAAGAAYRGEDLWTMPAEKQEGVFDDAKHWLRIWQSVLLPPELQKKARQTLPEQEASMFGDNEPPADPVLIRDLTNALQYLRQVAVENGLTLVQLLLHNKRSREAAPHQA